MIGDVTNSILTEKYSIAEPYVGNIPEQVGRTIIGTVVLRRDRTNMEQSFTIPSTPYKEPELSFVSPSLSIDETLNNTIRFVDAVIKKRFRKIDLDQKVIKELKKAVKMNLELFKVKAVGDSVLEDRIVQLYSFISLKYYYGKLNNKQKYSFDKSMEKRSFFRK